MTRLRAAFDLLAWPVLGTIAACIRGPLLTWCRETPAPGEDEADYLA